MHSAFLWFSCHRTEMYGEIAAVVKPPIHPQSLPEFFWRHLRKDIEQLSRATGKSPDESAIIVHLVLQNVLLKEPPTCKLLTCIPVSLILGEGEEGGTIMLGGEI